jgi:hypothetical protein
MNDKARWLVVVAASLALPLVLLNSHVWSLGYVVSGDVGDDYGLFTWNFWQIRVDGDRPNDPREIRALPPNARANPTWLHAAAQ